MRSAAIRSGGALALIGLALACSGSSEPPEQQAAAPEAPAPEPAPPAFTPDEALAAAISGVPDAWRDKANPLRGEDAAAAGAALYEEHCAACHGINGDGDGPAARALPQPPTDFTDSARWTATTLGEKAWLTMKGIPRTAMAPRDLSEEAIWSVLLHIESSFQ